MPTSQQRRQDDDGPGLGEVARLIEALRTETTSRFDKIDGKFDRLDSTYVRRETYDALATSTGVLIDGLRTDVSRLQNSQSWLLRTLGAAVIVALIGAFFAASKFLGGA